MIRIFLCLLYLALYLILFIPVLLILWIVGKFNPNAKNRISRAMVSWAFRCVRFLAGTKVIVKGVENIPKDTAVLYVGNHRSYFDIILSYPLFPGLTGYVAKAEMNKFPLLRDWMRYIHCLFLDRENIKEGLKTILEGVEKVKSGISLCIFPEGTRNKVNDTFLPFHEGSFKIADKGKVPVIPMTIVNSAAVFEDQFPRVKKTKVVISFGEPIYIDKLEKENRKSLATYVGNIISEEYFALKKEYFN